MEINVVMKHFDSLNDDNAMFIEFRNGSQFLVDNNDIVRADGDLIEIKSSIGTYVVEADNICGLKISDRIDIIGKEVLRKILDENGDA